MNWLPPTRKKLLQEQDGGAGKSHLNAAFTYEFIEKITNYMLISAHRFLQPSQAVNKHIIINYVICFKLYIY